MHSINLYSAHQQVCGTTLKSDIVNSSKDLYKNMLGMYMFHKPMNNTMAGMIEQETIRLVHRGKLF